MLVSPARPSTFSPVFASFFASFGAATPRLGLQFRNCHPGCFRGRRATPNSQVSIPRYGRINSKGLASRHLRQGHRAKPVRLLRANARSFRKGHAAHAQNLFRWQIPGNPRGRRVRPSHARHRRQLPKCQSALFDRSKTVAHRSRSPEIWKEGLNSFLAHHDLLGFT